MSATRLAVAVAASLAFMSTGAWAQVSFQVRGLGIGVGVPLIAPPQERPRNVERYHAPQRTDRVQRRRNTDDDDVKTAKRTPAKDDAKDSKNQNENSSIVTIDSGRDKPEATPQKVETASVDTSKSRNENSSIVSIESGRDKTATTEKTETARVDASKSRNENSTIASVASTATADAAPVKADAEKSAGCKRYFPTAGQTISVPCD